MDRYLSVAKMIEVEKASDRAGHTYPMMMARAGRSLADEILLAYGSYLDRPNVLGLVGSGNNGGDALVAMTHLMDFGWPCSAYLTAGREDDPLVETFTKQGGKVVHLSQDNAFSSLLSELADAEILLDGLLGTGIKLPLRAPVDQVLEVTADFLAQSESTPRVVAVDCPSGINCDSGETAEDTLPADLTVCMAAVKQGLLKFPAYGYLGELVIGDIGLDPDLPEWQGIDRYVLNETGVQALVPKRTLDGHKGTFGTALVVGGSVKYPGAPVLASEAAFRVGAGWVEIAIPKSLHPHLAGSFREATWMPLPDDGEKFSMYAAGRFKDEVSKADAVLLGPGIGLGGGVPGFIEEILPMINVPLVLDADGLKTVASFVDWPTKLPSESVLTPHPGEMGILTGLPVVDIQAKRVELAEEFAKKWGQTVVLKGAFTVVASPEGTTAILPVATPALARAGTGDVLAGMITGLLAQGMGTFEAACAGVWLHARAGLLAANKAGSTAGVLSGDLVKVLPEVMPY
ncbi:MAG: NAD(P)H-hydrate dehydratase [Anaerolineales bacterium]